MIHWIKLYSYFINPEHITHVNLLVYGRDCDASYEKQDEKFLVINLSCGQSYRVPHKDPEIDVLLDKLGLSLN